MPQNMDLKKARISPLAAGTIGVIAGVAAAFSLNKENRQRFQSALGDLKQKSRLKLDQLKRRTEEIKAKTTQKINQAEASNSR